jgi:hypothetical protein
MIPSGARSPGWPTNPSDVAQLVYRFILPAAYALLPASLGSDAASRMLIAIALQESAFQYRLQIRGPARSFWMFEQGDPSHGGGVTGLFQHARTRPLLMPALAALRYPAEPFAVYRAMADNDVLAAVCARLLLWSLPQALPRADQSELAWSQYLDAWQPGKPHPETWGRHWERAWSNSLVRI